VAFPSQPASFSFRLLEQHEGTATSWKSARASVAPRSTLPKGLDAKTRDAAQAAADKWLRLGPQVQAALSPEPAPPPVDKQVE